MSVNPSRGLLLFGMPLLLSQCLVQEVDLRSQPDGSTADCVGQTRLDPETGLCVPCKILAPPPWEACLCHWAYRAAPLPFCDAPDAYYECLPCWGDITVCNDYIPATRTTHDCQRLTDCCAALAKNQTPCCPSDQTLHCVVDWTVATDGSAFAVGCLPEPCCTGPICPTGPAPCAAWQSCESGGCAPACEPGVSLCAVTAADGQLGCACQPLEETP